MTQNILYSFRRCPYAMRARLALVIAEQNPEVREIVLRDKPQEMLDASPKGTVPVLVLDDGRVIDESFDIMIWALEQNDPQNWLAPLNNHHKKEAQDFLTTNDGGFKQALDHYKYPTRYAEDGNEAEKLKAEAQSQVENFFEILDHQLKPSAGQYLFDHFSIVDAAILPFIRQAAHVDLEWFNSLPFKNTREWLKRFKESDLFKRIMFKTPPWQNGDETIPLNKISKAS